MLAATLAAVLLANEPASPTPVIDALRREALAIQTSDPARWGALGREADELLAEHADTGRHWMNRGAPPLPDLNRLQLPLAFVGYRLEHESEDGLRFAWIAALAANPDERRIDALLECGALRASGPHAPWPYDVCHRALPAAMTEERAFAFLEQQLKPEALTVPPDTIRSLVERFASTMPASLRMPCYDWIRERWRLPPDASEGQHVWDLLLTVDAARARDELVSYGCGTFVATLLERHAGPSPVVAAAMRRCLAELVPDPTDQGLGWTTETQLLAALVQAAPASELRATLRRLEETVAQRRRHAAACPRKGLLRYDCTKPADERFRDLVRAVVATNADQAVAPLMSYLYERDLDLDARFEVLDWLASRRHPGFERILARWLRDPQEDYTRYWITNYGHNRWGAYGEEMLRAADAINVARR